MLLVGSLSGRHPLKCSTLISSSDLDLHIDSLSLGNLRWKSNGKRTSIGFYAIANVELDAFPFDFYNRDVKEAVSSQ
jgi:hypothetical protein